MISGSFSREGTVDAVDLRKPGVVKRSTIQKYTYNYHYVMQHPLFQCCVVSVRFAWLYPECKLQTSQPPKIVRELVSFPDPHFVLKV